jgi:hypothetical protein
MSNPDQLPTVEDWDNRSVGSFAQEKSVRKAKKEIIRDVEDLVDFDEDTKSHFSEASKYKDVTGSKVKSVSALSGFDNREYSDESDLEVDFKQIESNLDNLAEHNFYLRNKYAEYNEPDQKRIDELAKNIKLAKEQKLEQKFSQKSRALSMEKALREFMEDGDKENVNSNIHFKQI